MSTQALAELQNQNPDSPWLWNPEWNESVVRTRSKKSAIGAMFMGILWNAISWPLVVLMLPSELESENYWALVALIFPLAGIGFAVMAFRAIRRYMKFGESSFLLASNPGIIGGELVGVIKTSANIQSNDGYQLTLNCIRRWESGTGKNRRVREKILWQTMQRINRSLESNSSNETAIPVQIAIPFECEPCSPEQKNRDKTFWKLEITADQPGVDFHAAFEVPVFKTDASDPGFVADQSLVEGFVHQPSNQEIYEEARLHRQSTGDQLKIEFPFLRDVKSAICTSVFLAIWLGFTALLFFGIDQWGVGTIFCGVFALFGLLIFAFAFELWMWRGSITVDRTGIEARNGCLSMKRHSIATGQIEKISFKRTMQTGNLIFFDLNVETEADKPITIGKRICNEATCRAIIEDIEKHLGQIESKQSANGFDGATANQLATESRFPSIELPVSSVDSFQSQ